MENLSYIRPPSVSTAPEPRIAAALIVPLNQLKQPNPAEDIVEFGRWWRDPHSGQVVLSPTAARFLNVEPGWHASGASCCTWLAPADRKALLAGIADGAPGDCEVAVISERDGLRSLRIVKLPATGPGSAAAGLLVDITQAKYAAIRERLSFESTQLLVGTGSVAEAVTRIIELVCVHLGWEWGAYWAPERGNVDAPKLVCKQSWHHPHTALDAFGQDSLKRRMAPGEGLVGSVWKAGSAQWIEDLRNESWFVRSESAAACGLRAGYAFPVSFVMADGRRRSFGVLEFFSRMARQRDAQLPALSTAIGGLIAQTALRLEQQDTIRKLAQLDGLTGLSNRTHFHQLLDLACLDAGARDASFGVIYIDLDRFKPINDAFGHEAGDVVLHAFAQRLRKLVPEGCGHVARLGGDEFAILNASGQSHDRLHALAKGVLLAARLPFAFAGKELSLSASVGIGIFPEQGRSAQALLRAADAAMYGVKQSGRNGVGFPDAVAAALDVQQSTLARQLTMEAELHHALDNGEFFLEYQPVFDRDNELLIAVEALIRWRRPSGEIVRPDVFIPIAEQSRFIVQLGRWVVESACRDLALLQRRGFERLQLNVNMAAPEFINACLPDELTAVVKACGIAPQHLCLELTEGMVMTHADKVIPIMHALRAHGFKISLDDFGMGYSSLSRLKELPISSLKIDGSFVRGLPHDRGDCAIVRSIIDLGHHMRLQIIAEGVETDAQLLYLRNFGCNLIQGFLLSRPLALDELIRLHGTGAGG